MSSPYVIVSAVYNPESSVEEWWKDNQEDLDEFEKATDHNGEDHWEMSEGIFKSTNKLERYPVKSVYHSGRGERVIEIIISGKKNMQDIQLTGLEEVITEINEQMDSEFTLETYYWYNGVDRPGGVSR